jgi:hypothetical protein
VLCMVVVARYASRRRAALRAPSGLLAIGFLSGGFPPSWLMDENLRGAFVARGADSVTATKRAFVAMSRA